MTEFEEFKQFFDKYGVDYIARDYSLPGDRGKSYIDVVGTYFEFKDGDFTHLYEPDFDTILKRKK